MESPFADPHAYEWLRYWNPVYWIIRLIRHLRGRTVYQEW